MSLFPQLRLEADVAVIGSGFAGCLLALALRRQGRTVVMLERGRHPRFAIGESSTPLANLLLEELADTYSLPRIRPFSKWGTWQEAYPGIGCGLKRGFSFLHHDLGRAFADGPEHARQMLVAASPHDAVADTHWYRPDVDQFLAGEAVAEGATLLEEITLDGVHLRPLGATLEGTRHGRSVAVRARFVIDASGARGFLQQALALPERPLRWLPPTQALYAHFQGVARWDPGFVSAESPPYRVDDAALHHVFEGGWIWVLRFANGLTSAGAAVTETCAARWRLHEGALAWQRLLHDLPSVGKQFAAASATRPFVHAKRMAFRGDRVCGERFALLPSAVGVIDPLLSTGFPLTLLGILRLAECLARDWERPQLPERLAEYARHTQAELDATERLVAALYSSMADFELFKRLSLLYFAAASFSETARRLGRAELAPGFVLCGHASFGQESAGIAEAALARPRGQARRQLLDRIDAAIAPFDVAGFGERSRRDWYPVRAEDLLAAAPRLRATPDELAGLLERSGFTPRPGQAVATRT